MEIEFEQCFDLQCYLIFNLILSFYYIAAFRTIMNEIEQLLLIFQYLKSQFSKSNFNNILFFKLAQFMVDRLPRCSQHVG